MPRSARAAGQSKASLARVGLCLALLAMPGAHAAIPSLAAGTDRSCAVSSSGGAYCWGDSSGGALGNSRALSSPSPVQVRNLTSGVSVLSTTGNSYHTCSITGNGAARCWGDNSNGQLGNGTALSSTVPSSVLGLGSGTAAISTGSFHTCALRTVGDVYCWGTNSHGRLGDGGVASIAYSPRAVVGLPSGIRAIAAGGEHTCALSATGGVWCWGNNTSGQVGDGTFTDRFQATAVSGLGSGVAALSLGFHHSCAVTVSGALYCWGANHRGQLGIGNTTSSALPMAVSGLSSGITQVSTGGYHTCALRSGGVLCWGFGENGQVGNGSTANATTPQPVTGLASGIRSVALGAYHSCAVTTSGGVWCWGFNGSRQFGNGLQTSTTTPVAASNVTFPVVTLVAGWLHNCALNSAGGVLCWGSNRFFQLGDGQAIGVPTPTGVTNLSSGVASIGTGDDFSCALMATGGVKCWGNNSSGQLGDGGSGGARSFPDDLAVPVSATALSVGWAHSCYLSSSGGVLCWGRNDFGGLGNGTTSNQSLPVTVAGLSSGASAISAGALFSCAIVGSEVRCWGRNDYGQLGNGGTTTSTVPVSVRSLPSSIAVIAAGGYHACVVTGAGGVLCWGSNSLGRLGNGSTTDSPLPVQVSGLGSGVRTVAAGTFHTCALTTGGAVYCWGYNGYGQLGNGTSTDSYTPVAVPGLGSGVIAITVGDYHSCALMASGITYCWGRGSAGGLGDGSFASRRRPAVVASVGGSGTLAGNNWYLDLIPESSGNIPSERVPNFLAVAAGSASTAVVNVDASIQFRPTDVGNRIFVFGYVPGTLGGAAAGSKEGTSCVLAQIGSSGQVQQVSAGNLASYTSNVVSAQQQSVTLLNNIPATQVAGSTFCVGTGQSGVDGTNPANVRCLATVPSLNPTTPPCHAPEASSGGTANAPGALSGLWWNANESGWGIHFTQRSNNIFAAWYTYDTAGNPKWYVASNCVGAGATSGTCSGTLYEVSGPTFFGTTFNPNLVNVVTAGSLQVSFTNANSASMSYTVAGQSRTVAIVRQPLGGGTIPGVDYTDLWWNPGESGWGMVMAQQGTNIFLAWYVYDNSGRPMWYVASNCTVSGAGCTGTLYRTTGPPFGPTFNSSAVQAFAVGSATLTFSDANNGTLSYTVSGVSGSKAITRQLF
jgi:alpha-tubulin suppressor-like RCC1 family protein